MISSHHYRRYLSNVASFVSSSSGCCNIKSPLNAITLPSKMHLSCSIASPDYPIGIESSSCQYYSTASNRTQSTRQHLKADKSTRSSILGLDTAAENTTSNNNNTPASKGPVVLPSSSQNSSSSASQQYTDPKFIEAEFFSPSAKKSPAKIPLSVESDHKFKKGKLSLLSYARLVDMGDFIQRYKNQDKDASPSILNANAEAPVDDYKDILVPSLLEFLKHSGIEKLSDIQAKSLSCTLKAWKDNRGRDIHVQQHPESVLLASQTGSGKTLAYLLPLIHNIKYDEVNLSMGVRAHRPRAMILVPSRQLASQVCRVAKSISHHAKFRAVPFRSDFKTKRMRIDAEDADVVVTTPGVWRYMLRRGYAGYSSMDYIVVDEADSMLDEKAFGKEVSDILSEAQKKNANIQYFFAMATVNHSLLDWTSTYAPKARVLASESVHRHVPSVRQSFIDCSQLDKLKDCLLPLVRKEKEQAIIFCNTVDSARAVNLYLQENDVDTSNFHAQILPREQHEEFERFRTGAVQFLVTTDIASRGLDLTSVKHVINFDFPKNHVDYIHRIGRTGRFGAEGKVTSLLKKRDKGLAESIKRAILSEKRMDSITDRVVEKKYSDRRPAFGGGGARRRPTGRFTPSSDRQPNRRRTSKPSAVIGKNPRAPPSPEGW